MYGYGLIGNCQTAALVGETGSVDWLCMPRPDSPPVFGRLLDPDGGQFSVDVEDFAGGSQSYLPNTNVLVTNLRARDGSALQITDFCPRFEQHGRMYRPISVFRVIQPVAGSPRLRVICRPVDGWEKQRVRPVRGNSHLRYEIRGEQLRLTTNMSLTHLSEESSFSLKEPVYLALTWGAGIEDDLVKVAQDFMDGTIHYWRSWVKHCSIPSLYQRETIRSALALKLHVFEDTGAILAALTTSLPEHPGHSRNWDYRFCWLRDAYYVLSAFHSLGHFEEMEGFLKFLLNIAHRHEHSRERLRPVYALDQTLPLPEREHANWAGFSDSAPVRSNNQAAEHVQNDVYGEMILTLAPIFFDERFHHLRTPDHEELLQHLVKLCIRNISQSDAGLWEVRNGWQEHSFSNLMCWAGIERIGRMQEKGFLGGMELDIQGAKVKAEKALQAAIRGGSLRNGPADDSFDAALLQVPLLRYPDAQVARETVMATWKALRFSDSPEGRAFLYRYLRIDDFGKPQSSFLVCSFWLVQALVRIGETEQAREVMSQIGASANPVGLFAEHYLPSGSEQWGNFPQAYSHVGMINAAFALSPPWDQIL